MERKIILFCTAEPSTRCCLFPSGKDPTEHRQVTRMLCGVKIEDVAAHVTVKAH